MKELQSIEFPSLSASTAGEMKGAIIIPVIEGKNGKPVLGAAAIKINRSVAGMISRAMETEKFTGKNGKTITLTGMPNIDASKIVLIGVGTAKGLKSMSSAQFENMGGEMAAAIFSFDTSHINLLAEGVFPKQALRDVVTGFQLRHYDWNLKSDQSSVSAHNLKRDLYVYSSYSAMDRLLRSADIIVPAVHGVRNLVNRRANDLGTDQLRLGAQKVASQYQLLYTMLGPKKIDELAMGGIAAVGGASPNPPYVVTIEYNGHFSRLAKKVALVGKGLVYDTGGLSIKPTDGMLDMHIDMGGAAAVLGAMQILAQTKPHINVCAVIGIAENVTGSKSYRPGDILKMMSGQTVEVGNTDAEGRLVLADCMTYAQKNLGATTIIEASTLTGAACIALHDQYAALMTRDDELAQLMMSAAAKTNEPLWRLPMGPAFSEMLKSPSGQADFGNMGSPARMGGATVGGEFLQKFVVDGNTFVHLDIAPIAWLSSGRGIYPSGATGYGARLMAQAVMDLAQQQQR